MVDIEFKHKHTASLTLPLLRLEVYTDDSLLSDQVPLQKLQSLFQSAWPAFLAIAQKENLYDGWMVNFQKKVIQIELIWTDNKTMQALNAQYRQKNEATDVLTFTLLADAENPDLWMSLPILQLGSIFISVEYAKEALEKEQPLSEGRLIHYLLERFIHGVLHLFGIHHDTMEKYDQVVRIQKQVLEAVFSDSSNVMLNESTVFPTTSV
jgi:probable rRNA maturation factor